VNAVSPARHDDEVRSREYDADGNHREPQAHLVRRQHEPQRLAGEEEEPPRQRSHRPEDDGAGADVVGGIAQLHEANPVMP